MLVLEEKKMSGAFVDAEEQEERSTLSRPTPQFGTQDSEATRETSQALAGRGGQTTTAASTETGSA